MLSSAGSLVLASSHLCPARPAQAWQDRNTHLESELVKERRRMCLMR